MYAALYRSACKTVTCWPGWCSQLKTAAQEALPISRWSKGYFYPKFWDSAPFACNLEEANLGFPNIGNLSEGVNSALIEIQHISNPGNFSLQKVIYEHLLASSFRLNCVHETIHRRISSIFKPYDISETGIDIAAALSLCTHLRKHDTMRIIRTWCNGWATSHRFHETVRLPCLFGCIGATDSFSHYVHCPYWLHLLQRVLPHPPSVYPLSRLGLVDANRNCLLAVAASYGGYHAVKRRAGSLLLSSEDCSVEQRHSLHRIFLDAFNAEASDNGLKTNALSSAVGA